MAQIDTAQFLACAIEIAKENLPYCDGDRRRASRSALQGAHVNLGQAQFFTAIDALGGDEAIRASIEAALWEDQ